MSRGLVKEIKTDRFEIFIAVFITTFPVPPNLTSPSLLFGGSIGLFAVLFLVRIDLGLKICLEISLFMKLEVGFQAFLGGECTTVAGRVIAGWRVSGTDVMLQGSPSREEGG